MTTKTTEPQLPSRTASVAGQAFFDRTLLTNHSVVNAPTLPLPNRTKEPTTPEVPGRSVVLFKSLQPPQTVPGSGRQLTESPLKGIIANLNARAITPRQMQELSLDLYVGGIISWDEHAALAFQPDLHPDFTRTIGALTGERPLPDQPRDYVKEWEQKLAHERRFAPATNQAEERALHILSVLRRIDHPSSLLA